MTIHTIERDWSESATKDEAKKERASAFGRHLASEIDDTFLAELKDENADPVLTFSTTIVILTNALGRVISSSADHDVDDRMRKLAHDTLDTMIDEGKPGGWGKTNVQ